MSETWFVAGAAGGLGRHLVGAALAAGHDVLAADIDADGLCELKAVELKAVAATGSLTGRPTGRLVTTGIHATVLEPGGIRTARADQPLPTGGWHHEYEPTVGRFARTYQRNPDVQRGDPAKIAEAVLRLTAEPDPPTRLPLGSDAVWLAPQIAAARAAQDAAWRDLSLSTDRDGLPDFTTTEVAHMVRPDQP
ncbi:hypothetical protein KGQ20_12620 [Catenulispora sp. NF23]|uniref:hypothetical protein n=1 Tax=Catenulispora pinistramenti TaxID=2705254 RepID=UPI001BA4F700|nr:hypothetical protein [Catenulispora pinistramenti]MBS2533614.1 hypothetical protein [Catenulispora pinistramenti]